ncbi:MAP3K7 C-terminal-like protein isoform X2 [Alligator sinensis]|uniref:MAP3K7 C-terminal-like protein isoform X2 n=1 Tax=Alligator sinensis TaxID=38654 RepID=A0A3Q0GCC6_ALLSI|nr:MAP3K7 C-terminal-like protein isoform X2 [Alligator sinensis]
MPKGHLAGRVEGSCTEMTEPDLLINQRAELEHTGKNLGSSAHMITTARVPADKPVRIAFSLNDSPDDAPPESTFPLAFPDLDQQLQPLPPCHDSKESMQVYKQHCKIAEEYHEVKKEIALLEERKTKAIKNTFEAMSLKRSEVSSWYLQKLKPSV